MVPPFRVGARDRGAVTVGAAGVLGPVQVRASGDVLRDQTADGDVAIGPGDLRLGTVVARPFGLGFAASLGWEVKLPNAADEGELGTDETDVLFGAGFGWASGPWWTRGSLGLAVLGNPLRFANQDDVPMARLGGGWRTDRASVSAALRADFATARNPARTAVRVDADYGGPVFVRIGGEAGLSPAAPDWGARLGIGVRFPVPVRAPLPDPPSGG